MCILKHITENCPDFEYHKHTCLHSKVKFLTTLEHTHMHTSMHTCTHTHTLTIPPPPPHTHTHSHSPPPQQHWHNWSQPLLPSILRWVCNTDVLTKDTDKHIPQYWKDFTTLMYLQRTLTNTSPNTERTLQHWCTYKGHWQTHPPILKGLCNTDVLTKDTGKHIPQYWKDFATLMYLQRTLTNTSPNTERTLQHWCTYKGHWQTHPPTLKGLCNTDVLTKDTGKHIPQYWKDFATLMYLQRTLANTSPNTERTLQHWCTYKGHWQTHPPILKGLCNTDVLTKDTDKRIPQHWKDFATLMYLQRTLTNTSPNTERTLQHWCTYKGHWQTHLPVMKGLCNTDVLTKHIEEGIAPDVAVFVGGITLDDHGILCYQIREDHTVWPRSSKAIRGDPRVCHICREEDNVSWVLIPILVSWSNPSAAALPPTPPPKLFN